MTISEACQVWIEQRIEGELEAIPATGKSGIWPKEIAVKENSEVLRYRLIRTRNGKFRLVKKYRGKPASRGPFREVSAFFVLEGDLDIIPRAFPHNIEPEQAVRCACFLGPTITSQVQTQVRPEVPTCVSVHCPLFCFNSGSARESHPMPKKHHQHAGFVAIPMDQG